MISGDVWWAQEVQTIPFVGAPMTLVDNVEEIEAALDAWNQSNDWPRPLEPCPGGGDGPFDSTPNAADGGGPGEEGPGAEPGALDDDRGCGCRGDQGAHGLWLALGLLMLRPRRRR